MLSQTRRQFLPSLFEKDTQWKRRKWLTREEYDCYGRINCLCVCIYLKKLSLFLKGCCTLWLQGFVCFIRIPGLCVMRYTNNSKRTQKRKRSAAAGAAHYTLRTHNI